MLSKAEAEVISRLAPYSIGSWIARSQQTYLETQGIDFGLLLQMQELGVLSGVEGLGLNITIKSVVAEKFTVCLVSNGKALVIENDDPLKTLILEVYLFASVGIQILGLGKFEPDIDYLSFVGKHIAAQGFKVQLCDWRQLLDNQGEYFNAVPIDA